MNVSSHRKVSKMGGCRTIGQEVSDRRQGLRQTLLLLQLHVLVTLLQLHALMALLLILDSLDNSRMLALFHHHVLPHESLVVGGSRHRIHKRYSIGVNILYTLDFLHEQMLGCFVGVIDHSEHMVLLVGSPYNLDKCVDFFHDNALVYILLLNAIPNMLHIGGIENKHMIHICLCHEPLPYYIVVPIFDSRDSKYNRFAGMMNKQIRQCNLRM